MTILTIAAALMLATTSMAQDNGKKPPRTMNYYPDQGQIVCVNGNNRYTRALYGANTRQRLETSDRPVFASYDRDNSLNICFLMESNGQLQPLDSTTFCEARYEGGRRTYSLGDDGWLGGRVTLTAMATFYEEGAIWKIHTEGFLDPPALHAVARKLKKTKMTREGDYGLELQNYFKGCEAAGLPLQTLTWVNDSDTYILLTPQRTLVVDTLGEQHFAQEEACRQALISHLKISTPDPIPQPARGKPCRRRRRTVGRTDMAARLLRMAHAARRMEGGLRGRRAGVGRPRPLTFRRIRQEHGHRRAASHPASLPGQHPQPGTG